MKRDRDIFKGKFDGPTSIDIPPGESRDVGFGGIWRGREVELVFGEGENDTIILNEEIIKKRGYPVITVTSSNAGEIMAEIVPNFDKQDIEIREIKTGKKSSLLFDGIIKEKM